MLHRRLLVPLAVVPLAVGGLLTGTASAAPQTTSAAFTSSIEALAPEAAAPQAALAAGQVAVVRGRWSKASLLARRTPVGPRCTLNNASFIITNRTAVAQPVRSGTAYSGRVPANSRLGICGRSSAPFSATFVLTRTGDRLPVRFR